MGQVSLVGCQPGSAQAQQMVRTSGGRALLLLMPAQFSFHASFSGKRLSSQKVNSNHA
jgi:hypothetical protein